MRNERRKPAELSSGSARSAFVAVIAGIIAVCSPSWLSAEIPHLISYQCRIADAAGNFTGTGSFKFALVNAAGTTTYWSNDGSSPAGGQPILSVPLVVTKGLCSVLLGDTTLSNMSAIPASVFGNADVSLRVWFSDGSHGWQQLAPDGRIAAVGYAMATDFAVTVNDRAITPDKFAGDAVLANLNAQGSSGVPSGGIILSMTDAPSFAAAGYVRVGAVPAIDSWKSFVWESASGGGAPSPRHGHSAVWTGSEMIIWGGNNNGVWFNDGARYLRSIGGWVAMGTNGAPTPRVRHTAVWTAPDPPVVSVVSNGSFESDFSGWTGSGNRFIQQGSQFNPPNGAKVVSFNEGNLPPDGVLSQRCPTVPGTSYTLELNVGTVGPTAAEQRLEITVEGTGILLSQIVSKAHPGGSTPQWVLKSYSFVANSGLTTLTFRDVSAVTYELDLLLDNVRFNANNAAPLFSELLIWGGQDRDPSGVLPREVSRYNRTTDSWTIGSTVNAAEGRTDHSAVWTGTELIVWGGIDASGSSLNSGARYNRATDTWSPLSNAGAPSPRRAHTAVWTGSEMIVWGGTAPPHWLDDGARYNPATDTWSMLPSAGAPAGRSGHSALWAGSKMIVFGGQDGSSSFTDVRLYNPSTDSWTTGASIDAPVGRTYHSAVWTGTEMMVWGGFGAEGFLNGGGRYDLINDRWLVSPTQRAPAHRCAHSAVWTGSEVLVWGGHGSGGPMNELWRRLPVDTIYLYQKP